MKIRCSESLIAGIKSNLDVLSRRNLDEVVSLLQELGRQQAANELIDFADDGKRVKSSGNLTDVFDRTPKNKRIGEIAAQEKR